MTDQYGDKPTDHEGHDHEHDMTAAPEGEQWHGDQPPIDDFADHQAGEGAATVSEETEHQADAGVENAAPKKTSMLLPIIACVGGLLFLGAILYWQFGSSHTPAQVASSMPTPADSSAPVSPPAVAPMPAAAPTDSAAPVDLNNLKPQNPAVPDVAPTTAMASPAMPAVPPDSVAQTGSAVPNGMAQPVPPLPASMPIPTPAGQPPMVPLAPPAVAQAMPQASMADTPAPANVMVVTAPALQPAPRPMPPMPMHVPQPIPDGAPAISQSTDARLATLAGQVETLQRSLEQTATQLGHISRMMAANPPGAGVGNPIVEERLSKIEQQLAGLEQRANPAPALPPTLPPDAVTDAGVATQAPVTAPKAQHKTAHRHKTAKPTAASASRHAPHRGSHGTLAASAPAASLVIRAAVPGEAWVAKDATTRELRPVHVGDEVPGIGRVQGIHQNGDDWVIEGSRGTLR